LVLAACGGESRGPAPAAQDLTSGLEAIRSRQGLPALAGAIIDDRRVVEIAASGVRRLGDATRVTVDDRFHVGSCGKAMTATLVAMLVDEGRVGWDDRLRAIFPELGASMAPGWADVTVAHLLAHRAGIADSILVPRLEPRLPAQLAVTAQRLWVVEQVLSAPPTGTVGAFQYSSVGYTVVGAILERLTAQSWEELIVARLFVPLGMTSAGFDAPGTPGTVDQPWWHEWSGGQLVPIPPGPLSPDLVVARPAGGVHCSLADWANFVRTHLQGARGEASIVSVNGFRRMHTNWPGGTYALGWDVLSISGQRVLSHDGVGSFRASVELWPDRNRALLAATNCGDPPGRQGAQAAIDLLRQRAGLE
jgi:CubicO group peptidase (beta-lactamase class C family)